MTVVSQPFGTLLREYRVAAGLSQEVLAERARLSVETISALERGARRSPYGDTVARLADALSLAPEQRRTLAGASSQPRAQRRAPAGANPLAGDHQHHNIPYQTTQLVGRSDAMSAVGDLLARGRLVTLTGAPGVGKTRLALATAADVLESFPDGAWVAELAPVTNSGLVPTTVAALFALRDEAEPHSERRLARYLHHRRLLLVLDNCEHVLAACANLVTVLLQTCPEIRVLATSREPLRVAGEQQWRVPSLSVPADASANGLARSDSVALFVERAAHVDPAFAVRPADAAAVATICRRLDGIPLALELAAARVGTIPVDRIASALDDRFRLLTRGDRTALHRHQTLEASIAWSYDLLSPEEQIVFGRLGIFTGPWTLDLAQRFCAEDGLEELHVFDLVQSLVDKSLVVADFGRAAPYGMLESTRDYARERFAREGQIERLTRRHAELLRDAALRAHEQWHTGNDDAALAPIVAVIENVRAALDWGFSPRGDRHAGAALAAELLQVWVLIGAVAEGLGWVQRALEEPKAAIAPLDDETIARLQLAAGFLNLQLTRPAAAIEYGRLALAHFRISGDQRRVVEALDYLCRALRHAGRPDEALRVVDEGAALARAGQMPRFSAQFMCWRASAETGLRRFDDARCHLDDAAAAYRALGYSRGLRSIHYNLAHVEFGAGNYDRAIEVGGLAIAERRSAGKEGLWTLPQVLVYRAAAHIAVGALDAARADALEALERARQISETTILCLAVEQLALIAALRRNLPLAARLLGYSRATLPPGYERLYTEAFSYERLVALLEGFASDERDRMTAKGSALDEDALEAEVLSR